MPANGRKSTSIRSSDLPTTRGATPVNSWLVPSIVAALCLMPPTGILAVIFAAQVPVTVRSGNLERARVLARRARLWTIISFGAWIVFLYLMISTGRMGRLLESGVI